MTYIIVNSNSALKQTNGSLLTFEYPQQAIKYIQNKCNNSPYLQIKKVR